MKSRASEKFLANHPGQHEIFVNLLKSAKQTKSKFLWQREEDQINTELSNMVKNVNNLKFRKEDLICEQQRKRQKANKRVTWSKNLFDVRTITCGQSQGSSTAASWTQGNCDLAEVTQLKCSGHAQSAEPSSRHMNWSGETSSASSEELQLTIFDSGKLEQESVKFSFIEYCDHHQKQR